MNESFTAAMVVRSLLAAERSVWVAGWVVGSERGLLADGVMFRREVSWPAMGSVVVAVLMRGWFL